MDIKFHDAFESVMILNDSEKKISKKDEFEISFNKNIGFIEDYFNFTNNNISIHLLKKKFEISSLLKKAEQEEINQIALKSIDSFEKSDLKKYPIPVILETLAKSIEESVFNHKLLKIDLEKNKKKVIRQKNYYFLLMILFYIERIKTKLIDEYKFLILLNKVKIPQNFEEHMKKENFNKNYYDCTGILL